MTWTTDIPAKPDDFLVTGTATRSPGADALALGLDQSERSSRSFRLTLRTAAGVRYVTVSVVTEAFRSVQRATVRVR